MVSACTCCILAIVTRKFIYFICLLVIFIYFCVHRSDPTENDSVEGLRPNARGPGLVTFGVSVILFYSLSIAWYHVVQFYTRNYSPQVYELCK